MEMTIKQLADELGVCKQTISNAILQLDFQDTLHKVGNKYILSETQISQIKLQIKTEKSPKTPKSPKMPKSSNAAEEDEEKVQSGTDFSVKSPKMPKSSKTPKSPNGAEENEEKIQSETDFSAKLPKTPKTPKSPNETEKSTILLLESQNGILREQLAILNTQLMMKDNQIRLLQEQIGQLTVAMENLTTALSAEQALHAGTIQKQLAEHSVMDQPSDVEQLKQKRGLFSILFGRKN